MKRREVILPETCYKTTAMAESNDEVETLNQMGWKCPPVGTIQAIES